ncbi:hypothetical protein [Streptomyces sp. NPDC046821]|uniref:hypothetical protein n=1 Tax=Streptomyces sp. NPDC046821 TaxID=3154702 RepID=UPI0033C407C9
MAAEPLRGHRDQERVRLLGVGPFHDAVEARPSRRAQTAQPELCLHATRNDGLRAVAAHCYAAYDRVAAAALKGHREPPHRPRGSTRHPRDGLNASPAREENLPRAPAVRGPVSEGFSFGDAMSQPADLACGSQRRISQRSGTAPWRS